MQEMLCSCVKEHGPTGTLILLLRLGKLFSIGILNLKRNFSHNYCTGNYSYYLVDSI